MRKIDIEKIIWERNPKDIDELNQILLEEMQRHNDSPTPEFCGISPNQMRFLLYDPFNDNSPFGFQNPTPAALDGCPFFLLAEDMLRRTVLTSSPFKMTTSSTALPVKIVKELYEHSAMKDEYVESGITKLYKESDCDFIHVCKIVLEQAGVVRKQHNKWYLTKKGEKLARPSQRAALFQEVFQAFTMKYNWAYLDLYDHPTAGQMAFAFSLSLLAHFGSEAREADFYAKKYLTAFPMLVDEVPESDWDTPEQHLIRCYSTRFFSRFAFWWGLTELVQKGVLVENEKDIVRKREILGQLFRVPKMEG